MEKAVIDLEVFVVTHPTTERSEEKRFAANEETAKYISEKGLGWYGASGSVMKAKKKIVVFESPEDFDKFMGTKRELEEELRRLEARQLEIKRQLGR